MALNPAKLVLNKLPALLAGLKNLHSDVLVGVPNDTTGRKTVPGEKQAMNNATLAYIHDNGSPAANIPARPFMKPGVEEVHERIVKTLEKGAQAALHNNPEGVERALGIAGLTAQSSVRRVINAGIEPGLADSTIAARKARGRTGTKPLIDTGQLRNSINYVVRKK